MAEEKEGFIEAMARVINTVERLEGEVATVSERVLEAQKKG